MSEAKLISGADLSQKLLSELEVRVKDLAARGIVPKLTVILAGEDPASKSYVRSKAKMCKQLGLASEIIRLDAAVTQGELLTIIHRLNSDDSVHGVLVQLPLPKGISEDIILNSIDPAKDVDGFHPANVGQLSIGAPTFVPCTPKGVMYMLDAINCDLAGKHAVVVGRSNIVGKPVAQLLLAKHATVTICHSRTRDLPSVCKTADVLVAAVGRPKMITAEYVKPGAVVIDVGINRVDGAIVGDVDFDSVKNAAEWLTPVPGGVGKMTVAMLMSNTIESAERKNKA
ncbi:MAG: bifunctional 5,10-methylene-tetrahydrofolate dehydrogenase/5,10-methylene-tetrahydrofolate cyclohydrolase [Oscillospiraceae bacterium]|nr:bifunctional 5,10-methylene-tetrahydrofolate dehydrogenase/5,10-methylene-tetrahydrofolate cyclohydrolase [Oscillospiraceae bacterium]